MRRPAFKAGRFAVGDKMKENMQKPYIVLMNTETLLSPDLYAAAYEDVPEVRRRKTDRPPFWDTGQ